MFPCHVAHTHRHTHTHWTHPLPRPLSLPLPYRCNFILYLAISFTHSLRYTKKKTERSFWAQSFRKQSIINRLIDRTCRTYVGFSWIISYRCRSISTFCRKAQKPKMHLSSYRFKTFQSICSIATPTRHLPRWPIPFKIFSDWTYRWYTHCRYRYKHTYTRTQTH